MQVYFELLYFLYLNVIYIYFIKKLKLECELSVISDQLEIERTEKNHCKEMMKDHVRLINNLTEQNKIVKLKYGEG